MNNSKLKELINILVEANKKVAKLLNDPSVKNRAILYTVANEINSQFDDIFKSIGSIDVASVRTSHIEDILDSINVEDIEKEMAVAERSMLDELSEFDINDQEDLEAAVEDMMAEDELDQEISSYMFPYSKKDDDGLPEA